MAALAPATAVDGHIGELALLLLAMSPAELDLFLARQSPEGLSLCEQAMGQALEIGWRATPVTMAAHLTRSQRVGRIKLWRYSRLLGEKFRDAVRGKSTRQIWNLPARYGKSLIASQWGPTWTFDDDPTKKLILVSYGDELAVENAIAVRDLLRNHSGVLRAQLRRDRQRQDRFVTTEGGGLLAAGILSAITGFPAHGAIIDDPFKNWQEAHSEARRKLVEDQYRSVIRLRLETDDAWIIVVHTRWHEDDLTGRLIKSMEDGTGEPFEVVRLPAIAETYDPNSHDRLLRIPDLLGREPGEILEPERFSEISVKARHLALGCTPAETPILMGDWTVKPIGKVEAGDTVVGWVSEPGHKMRLVPSVVRATAHRPGTVLDYRLASGRTIRATRDHRWFTRAGRPYRPANVGTPLRMVCPDDTEPEGHERDLWCYLAGIVDGEGHISPRRRLNIVQSLGRNTPVTERILSTLDELGIPYHATLQTRAFEHWSDRVSIDVTQTARVYRTLIRHTPFAKSDQAVASLYDGAGRTDRHVDRVEWIGNPVDEEVYALETETGNYVAWGLASSNSYLTAGMEQQRPAPEEGGELKRAWWKINSNRPTTADDWLSSWDMKLKDKESGDFVVGQVWARTGSSYWLMDQLRGQWSQATTTNAICLMAVRWPACRRHIIENTGYGPEVMDALRAPQAGYVVDDATADMLGMNATERAAVSEMRQRGVGGLVPNNPKGDKRVRARGVSPYVEAGNVNLPEDAPWLGIFLDETAAFPNGTNDDQVDAFSQALSKLVRGSAALTVPEGQLPRSTITTGRSQAAVGGGTVIGMPTQRLPRGAPGRSRR